MTLAVTPPLAPMLARLERELPGGDWLYEPKWDGFRCLAFRDAGDVDLRSRNDRPLARYFPEIVDALLALPEQRFALDGELLATRGGTIDFPSLMGRIHPAASRVERLRRESPAAYVAFDLLALDGDALLERRFEDRRRLLERVLAPAREPLHLTPLTDDADTAAQWLERFQGAGIDGVVAKRRDLRYEPGARAMVKVKSERTADCVVAGFRWDLDRPAVASLLLGLHDEAGELQHVGVVSSLKREQRRELAELLLPRAIPLAEHPWAHGYLVGGGSTGRLAGSAGRWTPDMELDWVPLAPAQVLEVAYDQVDGRRFRHPARFVRWRPDREPASCTIDQLDVAAPDVAELLA
jgi:ATP-dependent DNA ligase